MELTVLSQQTALEEQVQKVEERKNELQQNLNQDVLSAIYLLGAHAKATHLLTQANPNTYLGGVNGAHPNTNANLGAGLGSSGGVSSEPPAFPPINKPSGAPNGSVPSNNGVTFDLNGYLDKLKRFINYIKEHPNDPLALYTFLEYISNLSKSGLINDPNVQALLGSSGAQDIILFAVTQASELAYFYGFNGTVGKDAESDFINQWLGYLNGVPSNAYTDQIRQALQGQLATLPQFDRDHFVNGQYIWDFGGVTYNFGDLDGKDLISEIIYNQGITGDPNSYFDDLNINVFNAEYRIRALEQLLAEFKDPTLAIMLWFMQDQDQDAQSQQSGLAGTTSLLTKVTNKYATPLLELAKQFKDFTPEQAKQFAKLLFDGTNIVNIESQLSSVSDTWNKNVFQAITSIKVDFKNPDTGEEVKTNLGDIMKGLLSGKVSGTEAAAAFQSLVPAAPSGSGSDPSSSPGFNAINTALEQAGGLLTGTSKTVSTELSTVASLDNAILKLAQSFVGADTGGIVALINTIVRAQKSA